jgi:hypothetical protein
MSFLLRAQYPYITSHMSNPCQSPNEDLFYRYYCRLSTQQKEGVTPQAAYSQVNPTSHSASSSSFSHARKTFPEQLPSLPSSRRKTSYFTWPTAAKARHKLMPLSPKHIYSHSHRSPVQARHRAPRPAAIRPPLRLGSELGNGHLAAADRVAPR